MEFLDYLAQVFTWTNMSILVLGTVGGLILGATPGLSPTMAVALLIPFTFQMEPAPALILLGAVYTATVAGGAVSAILVSIPGRPQTLPRSLTVFRWRSRAGRPRRCTIVLSARSSAVLSEYWC